MTLVTKGLTLALQLSDWNIVIIIQEFVGTYALTGSPRNESQWGKNYSARV